MGNIPLGSTISGFEVFHEGNHNNIGNPHAQYSPIFGYSSESPGNSKDELLLIFEINYRIDANYSVFYDFVLINSRSNKPLHLQLRIDSTGVVENTQDWDRYTEFIVTHEKLPVDEIDPNHQLTNTKVYIKPKVTYIKVNYKCANAIVYRPHKNATVYNQENEYAFECLKIYTDNVWENIELTEQLKSIIKYPIVFASNTNGSKSIDAGDGYTISIQSDDLLWNSIVSISLSEKLPYGLVTSCPYVSYQERRVYMNIMNVSSSPKEFPACVITCMIINKER